MPGTSQVQLNAANKHVPGFLGAFAADELPDDPIGMGGQNASLIVNYSDADSPSGGTHWVAMRFKPGVNALYFDSYGKHPDNFDNRLNTRTGFAAYLKKHSATGGYSYNSIDLQCYGGPNGGSDVCGEWSSAFVRIGELPKRLANNNEWDSIISGRTGPGAPFDNTATTGCARRDAAVFKEIGIRKHEPRGFGL